MEVKMAKKILFLFILAIAFSVVFQNRVLAETCHLLIINETESTQTIYINGKKVFTLPPKSHAYPHECSVKMFRVVRCEGGDAVTWTTSKWAKGVKLEPQDRKRETSGPYWEIVMRQ